LHAGWRSRRPARSSRSTCIQRKDDGAFTWTSRMSASPCWACQIPTTTREVLRGECGSGELRNPRGSARSLASVTLGPRRSGKAAISSMFSESLARDEHSWRG
jgi:hypothetical protein